MSHQSRLENDVYERIKATKRDDESFSDIVNRLIGGRSLRGLRDFRDVSDDDQMDEMREAIETADQADRDEVREVAERFE
ncbi:hypothetical protein C483_00864 [Natrialba hulunbeirensis JCM 10989]|uniref:Antitoxin n=1 Tax=Natrialba hulunbeirensis JCM 10989 TaxID=1227493 RepID=M0ACQ4_9EURY|nr:antitoxin VapB family protein [Natrialba hulunbeirensis]ELY95652.1 hypothetical protein C483_00864 [Natrialba hulunbeirensis JCM 10989]